ncbi:hypothetical protein EDB81DRAFT_757261 [Dactylonectria macrodidyma]|uniref:Uncharacterized protein n=1 Tax=Dactylonectria macrodidyma TaxID=307937 RepID=A0A9P9F8T4_9HYPO|nr:hypothetical protein EDB81DRAFT_757261 [Dactylonectria macrodidyma]
MMRSMLLVGTVVAGVMAQAAAPGVIARCSPDAVDCPYDHQDASAWKKYPGPPDPAPTPQTPVWEHSECPTEVIDCPYRQHGTSPQHAEPPVEEHHECPPEGCNPPVVVVIPCESCHHPFGNWTQYHGCPPQGCGFVKMPVPCDGETCHHKPETPATPPVCPGEGCINLPTKVHCTGDSCYEAPPTETKSNLPP